MTVFIVIRKNTFGLRPSEHVYIDCLFYDRVRASTYIEEQLRIPNNDDSYTIQERSIQ